MFKRIKSNDYHKVKLKGTASFSIHALAISILLLMIFMTVAYSAISSELHISGEAHFRVEADIRITNAQFLNSENGGSPLYNVNFSRETILAGINLPNLDSSVTFEINVTNFTSLEMTLRAINELNMTNPNITYRVDYIVINNPINGFETITFQITFHYQADLEALPENTNLEARIEFEFAILDTEPPVFTLVNNATVYFIGQLTEETLRNKVTAYDNIDGNVTDDITFTTNINFNNQSAGTFAITYTVSDQAGNVATHIITIIIWNFVQIESGQNNSLALTSHGEVWTWGANDTGQRGQGVTGNSNTVALRVPTRIPQEFFGNLPVVDIASGQNTAYAVNSAGHIFGWGNNASNRIGDGTTTTRNRPVRTGASVAMTFTQVDSQWSNAVALGTDGNIWAWGDQAGTGAIGDNSATNRSTPVRITTTGNFVDVTIGRFGGAGVTSDGHVYVWGSNLRGQLGRGNTNAETAANRFVPTRVPNLNNIIRVDYGERHLLALSADGYVYGWGEGTGGRLGNWDTSQNITIPRRIDGITNASDINTGNSYSQVRIGNDLYSFGPNADGRLFDGTAFDHLIPFRSVMNNVAGNVRDMSGNSENSFILSVDGSTVWGVGRSTLNNQSFGRFFPTSGTGTAIVTNTISPLSWDFAPPAPR